MASIHVRQRKDGSTAYLLAWRDGTSGRQERMTFRTEADAQHWKRLIEANAGSLTKAETAHANASLGGPTVQEHLKHHIDTLIGTTEYTTQRYRDNARLHIGGQFGDTKIVALDYAAVTAWIKGLEAKGLSVKTIKNLHGLLSAGMESAIRDKHLTHNPCKGVRLPKNALAVDDVTSMDLEDYRRIYEHLPAHYRPFFDFLLGTGCRYSEATALLATDFELDTDPATVRITKAHKLSAGGGRYVGPPKTEKGRRTVSLAPSTVEAVRPLVEAAGGGYVFTTKEGKELTSQAVYNRAWTPARKEAGLSGARSTGKSVTIHSIRHLHAKLLLGQGMNIYELSRRMGHASVQMTIDLYSDLMPDAHFRGADAATKALAG